MARKSVDLPADPLDFYSRHIYWPHKNNLVPVCEVNQIQRDYLERRTAFRCDEQGERLIGLDIIVKPRQVYMTSLCLGLLIWSMLRFPGFQAVTVLHIAGKTARKLWHRFKFALDRLPKSWGSISGKTMGEAIEWSNGSTWTLYTAGAGEHIADKIALSSTIHGLHLSESAKYTYPEAVWAATYGALADQTGWVIAECSPPRTREHWHMREYYASRDGAGTFTGAFFWPWYADSGRIINPHDIRYGRVMEGDFEATRLSPEDIQKESSLGLTDLQVAWRRWHFFQGVPKTIRKNRLEFPEDDENCFSPDELEPYLDEGALDLVDAGTREPVYTERVTPTLTVKIWVESPPGFLVLACDQASRNGADKSAVVVCDQESRDQIAEIHGSCYGDELASAIEWLVHRLLGSNRMTYREWSEHEDPPFHRDRYRTRHIVCADISQDFGLGGALDASRLRCYRGKVKNLKTRKIEYSKRSGIKFDHRNRNEIINQISYWTEGPQEPYGPQCAIFSSALAAELRTLTDTGRRIEHAKGYHDDLAIAWGIAHYVASRVKPKPHTQQASPRPEMSIHDRRRQDAARMDRSRSGRRVGGPA
jgi:hypothetical protein